jgi:hypothetical protein
MAVNRDCAEMLLTKLADRADGTKGGWARAETGAAMAVAYALLDVADAIREQTEALTGSDKRAILIERNQ